MAAVYVETGNGIKRREVPGWAGLFEKISEGFWFTVCLLLFMILGPFAAPIAIACVFFNNTHSSGLEEPELMSER